MYGGWGRVQWTWFPSAAGIYTVVPAVAAPEKEKEHLCCCPCLLERERGSLPPLVQVGPGHNAGKMGGAMGGRGEPCAMVCLGHPMALIQPCAHVELPEGWRPKIVNYLKPVG